MRITVLHRIPTRRVDVTIEQALFEPRLASQITLTSILISQTARL